MGRASAPLTVAGNRQARLAAAIERDGATCVWCGRAFGRLVEATTEHLVPRVKGGPSWAANDVAAGARCNHERGHVSPAEWLSECERRGWVSDASRVRNALLRLQDDIRRRGGRRRARPYLAAQLRRSNNAAGVTGALAREA